MAIDLCSENSRAASPRISFSYDLSLTDVLPIEHRPYRSNSTGPNSSFDFDFVPIDHEPSSADEIFSDGKILPIEIKKKQPAAPPPPSHRRKLSRTGEPRKQGGGEAEEEKQSGLCSGSMGSRSFWRFKRSTSLNCGSGHGRSLSLCPLPLLSRSNSTGSAPNAKSSPPDNGGENSHSSSSVGNCKNNKHLQSSPLLKGNNTNMSSPLKPPHQASSSSSSFNAGNYQKPPLRKGNAMKVNPVLNLNVAPSGNLFGLGSVFFTGGKDKAGKRK